MKWTGEHRVWHPWAKLSGHGSTLWATGCVCMFSSR